MTAGFQVEWLGCVPYDEALETQSKAVEARQCGAAGDRLLLLEHPPVITLGRSARQEHLLVHPEVLAERGIEVHQVNRGGDVTYHAPGQLVGYLIVDLASRGPADVHRFLRRIESALIDALSRLSLPARRIHGWTGVFVEAPPQAVGPPRKIASIGVGLRGWVSFHGFALNVTTDLAGFEAIVPCGLHDVEMSSVARELGASRGRARELERATRAAVSEAFTHHFA